MTDAALYQTCAALLTGAAVVALGFRAGHVHDRLLKAALIRQREALKAQIAPLKVHDNRRAALIRDLQDVTHREMALRAGGAPSAWRNAK